MSNQDQKTPRIWYLPGPFYRYEQNVKSLARRVDARIIDANVTDSRGGSIHADSDAPRVSLSPEYDTPAARAELEAAGVKLRLVAIEGAAPATVDIATLIASVMPVRPVPPAPPAVPLGSKKAAHDSYEIGSGAQDAAIGDVIAAALARSQLDVDAWNKQTDAARGKLILAEIDAMRNDAALALAKTLQP